MYDLLVLLHNLFGTGKRWLHTDTHFGELTHLCVSASARILPVLNPPPPPTSHLERCYRSARNGIVFLKFLYTNKHNPDMKVENVLTCLLIAHCRKHSLGDGTRETFFLPSNRDKLGTRDWQQCLLPHSSDPGPSWATASAGNTSFVRKTRRRVIICVS